MRQNVKGRDGPNIVKTPFLKNRWLKTALPSRLLHFYLARRMSFWADFEKVGTRARGSDVTLSYV